MFLVNSILKGSNLRNRHNEAHCVRLKMKGWARFLFVLLSDHGCICKESDESYCETVFKAPLIESTEASRIYLSWNFPSESLNSHFKIILAGFPLLFFAK